MRLSRLLISLISFLWLVIIIGILIIIIHNTRAFLDRQMESHSQDTATFLGLSISKSISDDGLATMTSMVDAVFDRGFYQEIRIVDLSGNILLKRHQRFPVKDVPAWFVNFVKLKTPHGNSLIMKGWRQIGKIEVISHPGYAYAELWRVSLQSFWLILFIGITSCLLVVLVVRFALAPLAEMEALALAISNRQFLTMGKIPWAQELRSVTKAMNTMSIRVKGMIEEETALAEKMRVKAYGDEVTGLANRRYFEERLDHLLNTPEEFSGGPLMLVYWDGFKEYNDRYGPTGGDQLLRKTGQLLGKFCERYEGTLLARTKGVEFSLLIPNLSLEETKTLGEVIIQTLRELQEQFDSTKSILIKVGITYVQPRQLIGEALSSADVALVRNKDKEANSWYLLTGDTLAAEKEAFVRWEKIMTSPQPTSNIFLQFQPVETCLNRQLLHVEVLARLSAEDGTFMPAGAFLHLAKRSGLLQEIDQQVVNLVMARMTRDEYPFPQKAAINLSLSSIQDADFMDWLCRRLKQNPVQARKLIFEIQEFALDNLAIHREIIKKIEDTGALFSIDHFGHSTAAIGHLRNLPLDCIKIDGNFIRQIHLKEDTQFFIQALVGIAHGLGIQVVAGCVETQEEFDTVKKMKVDAAMGYFIARPQ